MRDYEKEKNERIGFIRDMLAKSGCAGIIFANSGGKDCSLTGILCKLACDNTVSVILPCVSKRNFGQDAEDAQKLADQFSIYTRTIDLTELHNLAVETICNSAPLNNNAIINIPPRLRMITLYAIAASENRLVAGTGNRSERHMGYFTKWGDGACDFNPIGDLTVTEVYDFLRYLDAPASIIEKAPSAGLYDGQTDEAEMGVSYAAIDRYLMTGEASAADLAIIERYHKSSAHKRVLPSVFEH